MVKGGEVCEWISFLKEVRMRELKVCATPKPICWIVVIEGWSVMTESIEFLFIMRVVCLKLFPSLICPQPSHPRILLCAWV